MIDYKRFQAWWRVASSASHFLITIIATLAALHVLPRSNTMLAVLIAWANVCVAMHHAAPDTE